MLIDSRSQKSHVLNEIKKELSLNIEQFEIKIYSVTLIMRGKHVSNFRLKFK